MNPPDVSHVSSALIWCPEVIGFNEQAALPNSILIVRVEKTQLDKGTGHTLYQRPWSWTSVGRCSLLNLFHPTISCVLDVVAIISKAIPTSVDFRE